MPTEPRPSKAARRDEAREKALQLRAEQQKREKRNRIIAISGLVAALVVLAVVVTLILQQGKSTAGSVSYTGDEVTVADVTAPSTAQENGGIPVGAEGVAGEAAADTVVLDLYLDYMCPVCGQFEATNEAELASLRESGDLTVVYHPVSILDRYSSGTEYSTRASIAAAVVADQAPELFLAFNNALLANQPAENTTGLTDDEIAQIALDVDVPQAVVDQFVAPDGTNDWRMFAPYVAGLTADAVIAAADEDGQFGTPALVIDGERWKGDWTVAGALTEAVAAAKG